MAGLDDFDHYVEEHGHPPRALPGRVRTLDRREDGRPGAAVEKVEREEPADGFVIKGDHL